MELGGVNTLAQGMKNGEEKEVIGCDRTLAPDAPGMSGG
jgi:hypothetical protein